MHLANIFLDHCLVPSDTPMYIETNIGSQFVNRNFILFCGHTGVKHMTAAVYSSQTSGRAVRFNQTSVTCVRDYVAKLH